MPEEPGAATSAVDLSSVRRLTWQGYLALREHRLAIADDAPEVLPGWLCPTVPDLARSRPTSTQLSAALTPGAELPSHTLRLSPPRFDAWLVRQALPRVSSTAPRRERWARVRLAALGERMRWGGPRRVDPWLD